jgi:hypothetical protein
MFIILNFWLLLLMWTSSNEYRPIKNSYVVIFMGNYRFEEFLKEAIDWRVKVRFL